MYSTFLLLRADKLFARNQIVKLFDETAAQVQANEPGTLQYYAVRPKKGDELYIVERYYSYSYSSFL